MVKHIFVFNFLHLSIDERSTFTGAKSHMIYFEAGETNAEVKLKTEDVLVICPALAPSNVKLLPKPASSNDIRRFAVVKETKRKLNSPQVKKPEKLMKHLTPQKLGDVSRQLEEEVENICDILESSSLKDDLENCEDESDELFNLNRLSSWARQPDKFFKFKQAGCQVLKIFTDFPSECQTGSNLFENTGSLTGLDPVQVLRQVRYCTGPKFILRLIDIVQKTSRYESETLYGPYFYIFYDLFTCTVTLNLYRWDEPVQVGFFKRQVDRQVTFQPKK